MIRLTIITIGIAMRRTKAIGPPIVAITAIKIKTNGRSITAIRVADVKKIS